MTSGDLDLPSAQLKWSVYLLMRQAWFEVIQLLHEAIPWVSIMCVVDVTLWAPIMCKAANMQEWASTHG